VDVKKAGWLSRAWPGIFTSPEVKFLQEAESINAWRLFIAVMVGSSLVLVLGKAAQSSSIGYGYGAVGFTVISWPFVPRILRGVRWTDTTIVQAVFLLIASLMLGDAAERILGFNPQASGLKHFDWKVAGHLLWQFPLVLPVENLLLVGAMGWLWKFLRPLTPGNRFGVALLGAALFGLWHVPFWGPWTMWTIGASVLPWTIYMLATGDLLVPVIAHILMDVIAVVSTFAPKTSFISQYFWLLLIVVLITVGLSHSLYRDWRARGKKIA
jgi:hypothetical protein